jgi:hypothetical protein
MIERRGVWRMLLDGTLHWCITAVTNKDSGFGRQAHTLTQRNASKGGAVHGDYAVVFAERQIARACFSACFVAG